MDRIVSLGVEDRTTIHFIYPSGTYSFLNMETRVLAPRNNGPTHIGTRGQEWIMHPDFRIDIDIFGDIYYIAHPTKPVSEKL